MPIRLLLSLSLCASVASSQPGIITTYAGGYPDGMGGPARDAALQTPGHMVEDRNGNVYLVGLAVIYKISPDGRIVKFAGTGVRGSAGDGGPALSARINTNFAGGIAIDASDNIIVVEDSANRIRRISPDGVIRTIAGTGFRGFSGDGGPATAAQFAGPGGVALDPRGNLYVADTFNERVRRIAPDGTITTVAGNGIGAYTGDGGPATQASLFRPADLAFDSSGNLYIADSINQAVRRLAPDGIITTVVHPSLPGVPSRDDSGPFNWGQITSMTIDRADTLYIGVGTQIVLKRDSAGKFITFRNTSARSMMVDARGRLWASNAFGSQDVGIINSQGVYQIVAGASVIAGANGPPAFARLYQPIDLAFDPNGILNALELNTPRVAKLLSASVVHIPQANNSATGITFDRLGNYYIANSYNDTIDKHDPAGNATVFAGRSTDPGDDGTFGGDEGPALQAFLSNPAGLTFDNAGSLYVADSLNHRIRKITPDGIIHTVAGNGSPGAPAEGAIATAAPLNDPRGVAVDPLGNIFIAEFTGNRIHKVTPGGIITTYAGTGQQGSSGDGGPAIAAMISAPRRVTLDAAGNLYFIESGRVRKVATNGIVSTVAGNGNAGFSGDGGPAIAATFNNLQGIALDLNGNIYVADLDNNRIRKIEGSAPFSISPVSLLFSTALDGPAKSSILNLASSDGASRRFQIRSNTSWLTATPESGSVSSGQAGRITVTANPAGLKKGTYPATLTVVDLDSGAASAVPVTLAVSGSAQQLRLSQVGLTFTAVQGGSAPPSQALQVLNAGTGAMAWTAAATTLTGSGWLSVTPASGTTNTGSVAPSLTLSVNPNGLAAGAYYGQLNVSAPGADNSPQSAIVLLRILPTGSTPGAAVDPSGLLFTATRSTNPPAQSVVVSNASARTVNYTVSVRLANGAGWLTAPANGSLTAGQSRSIDIAPRSTSLVAGVYRATVTFTFQPDNVVRTVEIAMVVNPASADPPAGRAADPACIPKQLVAVIRRPGASYQTAAGWPVPLDAAIADDCGEPLTAGRVTATFSSNDPPVSLLHSGAGIWQATWASRTTGTANLTVRVAAESIDQALAGNTAVAIRSDLNPDQPSINPGGVLNAASFSSGTPVPVGGYVSVFGSRLSKEFQLATTLPLPNLLGETSVFLGGKLVPLHFASDGQLNAILPYSIADNTTHQMIVRRGNVPSLPEPVLVASVQPAVFSYDGSGKGQGHIYVARADGTFLADAAHPVKAGDVILFYATGLGPVNPPVAEGQPAPADPLSLPVNPITVNVQGKPARVVFAGLAPGFAGVYQVNAIAPDGLTADPSATLVVSSGGQPSPPSNMAVTH